MNLRGRFHGNVNGSYNQLPWERVGFMRLLPPALFNFRPHPCASIKPWSYLDVRNHLRPLPSTSAGFHSLPPTSIYLHDFHILQPPFMYFRFPPYSSTTSLHLLPPRSLMYFSGVWSDFRLLPSTPIYVLTSTFELFRLFWYFLLFHPFQSASIHFNRTFHNSTHFHIVPTASTLL